jgi:hypothetical protein
MGSYSIGTCQLNTNKDSLQKPHTYNKYLPFYDLLEQQGLKSFNDIRENLSRTIQSGQLDPDFSIWSNRLQQFISLYGFNFTKIDHLKLIHFYLSILTISDLSFNNLNICFNVLYDLIRFVFVHLHISSNSHRSLFYRKTRLITRDDLVIDWRIFRAWIKPIYYNRDKIYGLATLPEFVRISFSN